MKPTAHSTTTRIDEAAASSTSQSVPSGTGSRRLSIEFPKRGDLPALGGVRSSKNARRFAALLMIGLVGLIGLMAFSPWLQTVRGTGRVTNFNPTIRPQVMQAPITGKVVRLGDNIHPMSFVKKGDVIAEMADLDPDRLPRMLSQLANREQETLLAKSAVQAAERELDRAESAVLVLESNVRTIQAVREQKIAVAETNIEIAKQRLRAAEKFLEEQDANLKLAQLDYKRQEELYLQKIAPQLKFQIATKDRDAARASVERAQADIAAATEEVNAKTKELGAVKKTTEADVQRAEVDLRRAEGQVEGAKKALAGAESGLNIAMRNETEARSLTRRQENQEIKAPFDGYVVSIYADGGSNVFNQGSPIATIVPESTDRVVEIWLDGNDAPLVEPGRHVRLQFEGWPAIQFSGWPSVAVGTFGGEVLSVDAVASDDHQGQFRALIGEVHGLDAETGLVDEPWPHGRFLRPGVLAKSWVLLDTVPLWWEVWRNLNGFPPVVDTEHEDVPAKVPKLPKP